MIAISRYLVRQGRADGYSVEDVICHWCPACKSLHGFATAAPFSNGAKWAWDGALDLPTFSPSMNVTTEAYHDEEDRSFTIPASCCHYRLIAGVLHYLGDCTHAMKASDVPLPELPEYYRRRL